MTCANCNGKGHVLHDQCRWCKGSGVVSVLDLDEELARLYGTKETPMMKPHCDNCDALIDPDVKVSRRLTVQPLGFQCEIEVRASKDSNHVTLCGRCLRGAVVAFAEAMSARVIE